MNHTEDFKKFYIETRSSVFNNRTRWLSKSIRYSEERYQLFLKNNDNSDNFKVIDELFKKIIAKLKSSI